MHITLQACDKQISAQCDMLLLLQLQCLVMCAMLTSYNLTFNTAYIMLCWQNLISTWTFLVLLLLLLSSAEGSCYM